MRTHTSDLFNLEIWEIVFPFPMIANYGMPEISNTETYLQYTQNYTKCLSVRNKNQSTQDPDIQSLFHKHRLNIQNHLQESMSYCWPKVNSLRTLYSHPLVDMSLPSDQRSGCATNCCPEGNSWLALWCHTIRKSLSCDQDAIDIYSPRHSR